jgi:hypothetical protein
MKKGSLLIGLLMLIIFLLVVSLLKNILKKENFMVNENKLYAIHAVFISKENILFLEEWIDYHIRLGFNRFYLYDNSKVTKKGVYDKNNKYLKLGKINKHNNNYDEEVKLTQEHVDEIMDKIVKKYDGKVNIIEWSPKDKNGNILYNQPEAHNHCLKRMKLEGVEWCASIDIDEFIVIGNPKFDNITKYLSNLDNNISALSLDQIKYENRFKNLDKNVIEITNTVKKNPNPKAIYFNNKNIFKVSKTKSLDVHVWKGDGKLIKPKKNEICFNHYKMNNKEYDNLDNIDKNIKNHIQSNSKNYIKNQYL